MDGFNGLGCEMYMAGFAIYFKVSATVSFICFVVSISLLSLFLSLVLGLMTALYISFDMLRVIIHFCITLFTFFLIALPRLSLFIMHARW